MQAMSCTYRFIQSSLANLPDERQYKIAIRQQPERAKMSIPNERDRRPIDPPPILQMQWLGCSDEDVKKCLQSPFYFLVANIVKEDNPSQLLLPSQDYLSGSTVSSLHRLRDLDNTDGGFFVFGDLAVKKEGKYKLHFSLFEIVEGAVQTRMTLFSDTFTTYLPKRFPGPLEATFLSRTFCDQGVKMRIRKEHRITSSTGRKRRVEKNIDPNGDASAKAPREHTKRRFADAHQERTPSFDDGSCSTQLRYGSWYSSPSSQQQQQQHFIINNNSSKERYIAYKHHDTSIQIPSPPPSITSHTSTPSEFGNHYCYPQVSNTSSFFTKASEILPMTPPPILADADRHRCNSSNDSLPSLRDIIAGTLPNTSRRLPAPISVSSPTVGRMPIHHHHHPSF